MRRSELPDDSPIRAIERRLTADPGFDDWLVYADALTEAGDPRGELVGIGVALARGDGDAAQLRQREDALLQQHAHAWFGRFVTEDWRECFGFTLEAGFWGRIRLWVDHDHGDVDLPAALAYALAHPSARFLRELDLGLTSIHSSHYGDCVRAVAAHGPLPSLWRLKLGDFEFPEESEISWVTVGDVGALWPVLTGLEQLILQGAGIGLGTPVSDSLRTLVLRTGGLPRAAGESLGRAVLPGLERLEVWFGTEGYGGSCSAAHARGILENPSLSGLRQLALANADFADDIAGVVAESDLPPKLEVLDLSMGTLTDRGAQHLLVRADALGRLSRLDLRRNYLSAAMCERVQQILPDALTGDQKVEDDGLYVSVGE